MGVILACRRIPIDQPGISGFTTIGLRIMPCMRQQWQLYSTWSPCWTWLRAGVIWSGVTVRLYPSHMRRRQKDHILHNPNRCKIFLPSTSMSDGHFDNICAWWTMNRNMSFFSPDDGIVRVSWDVWLFQRWATGCKLTVGCFFLKVPPDVRRRAEEFIAATRSAGLKEKTLLVFHRPTGPPAHRRTNMS